jgi:hypothetical protein
LLRKRIMDVLTNQRELHIESKRVRASCIRFWEWVSYRKEAAKGRKERKKGKGGKKGKRGKEAGRKREGMGHMYPLGPAKRREARIEEEKIGIRSRGEREG